LKSFGLSIVQIFLFLCLLTLLRVFSPGSTGKALSKNSFTSYLGFETSQKKKFPVPEFFPASDVFLTSLAISDYQKTDLVKALLEANTHVHLLVNSSDEQPGLIEQMSAAGISPESLRRVNFHKSAYITPWVRDFGPLPVFDKGQGSDFKLSFIDFLYDSDAPSDDKVTPQLARHFNVGLRSAPFIQHGGNFLTNGKLCFMGALPGSTFAQAFEEPIGEDEARTFVENYYRDVVGCESLVILNDPPHPHIDMWAKIVDPETVLISSIDQKTLDLFSRGDNLLPYEIEELKNKLDQRANDFAKYLKVIRIPMPLPYRGSFRNYTNALIVNDTVIAPKYEHFGWNYEAYPDSELRDFYESSAKNIYERFGYKVKLLNADPLIFNGGAFHCLAEQILLTE
jgi:agmatine/peptidylarginine deiminase